MNRRQRLLFKLGITPFKLFDEFISGYVDSIKTIGKFMKEQTTVNDTLCEEIFGYVEEEDESGAYQ